MQSKKTYSLNKKFLSLSLALLFIFLVGCGKQYIITMPPVFNNITINGTGQPIILLENSTVWTDVVTPLLVAKLPTQNQPALTSVRNRTYAYCFSDAITSNEEEAYLTLQLPHSYKENSQIFCHLHWLTLTNTTGSTTWAMEYTWTSYTKKMQYSKIKKVTVANGGAYIHTIADFGELIPFNKTISSLVNVRLYRNSGIANDTYTGLSCGLSFDCHIEMDTLGSASEYHKWT